MVSSWTGVQIPSIPLFISYFFILYTGGDSYLSPSIFNVNILLNIFHYKYGGVYFE